MNEVTLTNNTLHVGNTTVTFMRTLRLPDDGREYPLPPALGEFPVRRVSDYADRVPAEWAGHGGVIIPMYQREALWLNFSPASWKPSALQVGVGKVNALTGKPWSDALQAEPQNYVVVPTQPWLDGINSGTGVVKQFVAMPLGMGYTVEGQVTGEEIFGGIQLQSFAGKPGRFPEPPPMPPQRDYIQGMPMQAMSAPAPRESAGEMGIAAGGSMRQSIYPDPHGIDAWDPTSSKRVFVHIVNSQMWQDITGEALPTSPVSVHSYTEYGLPWFELYDDGLGDIAESDVLANVKTVAEMDNQHGFVGQQDNTSVSPTNIVKLGDHGQVKDGDW